MFEKVNPSHPDKIADRIAGAMVDLAYNKQENPKIAVEVLIGHGECYVIAETSVHFALGEVVGIARRITGCSVICNYVEVPQDEHLSKNQKDKIRCGDNGIFKGVPTTKEQNELSDLVRRLYKKFPADGKYVITDKKIVACQSHAKTEDVKQNLAEVREEVVVNPLGEWTGGINVDSGATNRKLGSDMGDSVTGGGLHGKDLSKADVSVNIYAWLKAQMTGKTVELSCAIGDECVDGMPYWRVVEIAREYIRSVGGFEKFAEWGLM